MNRLAEIRRTADRINRLKRRKRKPKCDGKPVGPRLVKGRGLRRRRPKSGLSVLVYLLIAAGLGIAVFRYVVVPFLIG